MIFLVYKLPFRFPLHSLIIIEMALSFLGLRNAYNEWWWSCKTSSIEISLSWDSRWSYWQYACRAGHSLYGMWLKWDFGETHYIIKNQTVYKHNTLITLFFCPSETNEVHHILFSCRSSQKVWEWQFHKCPQFQHGVTMISLCMELIVVHSIIKSC